MGLFKKSDDVASRSKKWDRMIAQGEKEAAKQRVDVAGSLACASVLQDGLASGVVVVWPDRVEVHSRGQAGSLLGKGSGVQSMPAGGIASVDSGVSGVFSEVRVHGSGNSITFKVGVVEAGLLQPVILEVAQAARGSVPAASVPPPPGVPAGWYPQGDVQRYWDGAAWTDHTAPLA